MPTTLEDIHIPDEFKYYDVGQGKMIRFLLNGDDDGNDILVFAREDTINFVHLIKKAYMDGTFKESPPPYKQIFVVIGDRGGFAVPLLYALLPNKREPTYRRLFCFLNDKWPTFEPAIINEDFEMATLNALFDSFPNAEIHCCLFHLKQIILRELGEVHFMKAYNNDLDFNEEIKMIMCLGYVPIDDLLGVVEELKKSFSENATILLEWFEVFLNIFISVAQVFYV